MLNKVIGVIKANRSIINNISYLSILQIINLVMPLITYPYLIRVLGMDKYGTIIYYQAIVGYLVLIISFGFNITATKYISINRFNKRIISKVVSSVLFIKLCIFVLTFLLTLLFVSLFSISNFEKKILFLTMWMGFYEVIFPVYYFQGMEKMKFITLLNFISKAVFLILVFSLIKINSQVLLYPALNWVGVIIVGVCSITILIKDQIRLYIPRYNVLFYYIKKSYIMAIAYASNNIKSGLNIILIKLLFSMKEVALFDLAYKIVNLSNTFFDILNQAIFPKMSREKNIKFLKLFLKYTIYLSLLIMLMLIFLAKYFVFVLGGTKMMESIYLLKIISPIIIFYSVGALLGRNCLIVFGKEKKVLSSMLYSSLFYIILAIIYYLLKVESIVLFSMIYVLSFGVETLYRFISCRINKIF